jgi:hypothetical protein
VNAPDVDAVVGVASDGGVAEGAVVEVAATVLPVDVDVGAMVELGAAEVLGSAGELVVVDVATSGHESCTALPSTTIEAGDTCVHGTGAAGSVAAKATPAAKSAPAATTASSAFMV